MSTTTTSSTSKPSGYTFAPNPLTGEQGHSTINPIGGLQGGTPVYVHIGGGGGGGGGGSSSPAPTDTTTSLPLPTTSGGTTTTTSITPPTMPTDYLPVYGGINNAQLVGFQSGTTFIPKETARANSGLYTPEEVKPNYQTNVKTGETTVTGYSNLSGVGGTTIVDQNGIRYYNVKGGGEGNVQYSMPIPKETQTTATNPTNIGTYNLPIKSNSILLDVKPSFYIDETISSNKVYYGGALDNALINNLRDLSLSATRVVLSVGKQKLAQLKQASEAVSDIGGYYLNKELKSQLNFISNVDKIVIEPSVSVISSVAPKIVLPLLEAGQNEFSRVSEGLSYIDKNIVKPSQAIIDVTGEYIGTKARQGINYVDTNIIQPSKEAISLTANYSVRKGIEGLNYVDRIIIEPTRQAIQITAGYSEREAIQGIQDLAPKLVLPLLEAGQAKIEEIQNLESRLKYGIESIGKLQEKIAPDLFSYNKAVLDTKKQTFTYQKGNYISDIISEINYDNSLPKEIGKVAINRFLGFEDYEKPTNLQYGTRFVQGIASIPADILEVKRIVDTNVGQGLKERLQFIKFQDITTEYFRPSKQIRTITPEGLILYSYPEFEAGTKVITAKQQQEIAGNIGQTIGENIVNTILLTGAGEYLVERYGAKGLGYVGQLAFSKPITQGVSSAQTYLFGEGYVPEEGGVPSYTIPQQLGRAGIFIASEPFTGIAFTKELATSLLKNPLETGKEFMQYAKTNPYEIGGIIVGSKFNLDFKTGKVSYEVPKTIQSLYTISVDRILGKYKPIETSSIGEKVIFGVKGSEGKFDIGIIQERGTKLDINPVKFVENYRKDIPLKENPYIPMTSSNIKKILEVSKEQDNIITGSFAQNVLLKKGRPYQDIDILAKNKEQTVEALKNELRLKFEKARISEQGFMGNKQLVDVVPLNLGEAGFVKRYGYIEVEGIKFVSPEARLASKIYQFAIGKANFEPKIIRDIELLTGGKVKIDLNKATLTGPYGYTKEELEAYVGKKGTIAHSSTGFFGLFKNEVPLKPAEQSGGFQVFFATPFDIKTGRPQTRVTRLGMEASILDLLKGRYTTKKPTGTPQILLFENQEIGLNRNINQYGKQFNIIEKSSELEVGLPIESSKGVPNILTKVKNVGVTLVNGKRVNIYLAEVKDANSILKEDTLNLLNKRGSLSNAQRELLNKRLYQETGIDYSSEETIPYFNPNRLYSKSIILSQKSQSIKKISSYDLINYDYEKNYTKSLSSEISSRTSNNSIKYPSTSNISKGSSDIDSTSKISINSYNSSFNNSYSTNYSYSNFEPTIKEPKINAYEERKRRLALKKIALYNVLIKKRGKFRTVRTGLTKEQALFQEQNILLNDIARTGKLVQVGYKEVPEFEGVQELPNIDVNRFRTYKQIKGKRVALPFGEIIQRSSANLQSEIERKQLKEARFMKNILN